MKKNDHLVKIASVKLNNGGLKGATVVYEKTTRRNSRDFIKTRTENNTECVHGELINLFEGLCNYLLDICCYTTNGVERKQLVNELEITGVTYGLKGFVLSGKLRVLGSNGKKTVTLNTPLVTEVDEYGEFDEVVAILDKIYAETSDYMAGIKTFKDDELLLKFNKNDDEFKDVFAGLDADAKKKMATEILEKMGSVVMHNEEIVDEVLVNVSEVVKKEGKLTVIKDNYTINEETVELDEIESLVFEDEDDFTFELPDQEVEKVSTAKKKKQA
jgi:hypothetical protein